MLFKACTNKRWLKVFITFINGCTRYCYVYLLKNKYEALKVFKHYKTKIENQLGKRIKIIPSYRGDKYASPFENFCSKPGIIYQTRAPYLPQSNGAVEHKKIEPLRKLLKQCWSI